MNKKKYLTWEEVRENLNITPEQEAEIQLEKDLIKATIEARERLKLSQRDLSEKSGVRQPVIARMERLVNSPQTSTLMKLLYAMGYTLKVVPLDKIKNKK